MLNKIKKLAGLIAFKFKYPKVVIIGGPRWLSILFEKNESIIGHHSQSGQDRFIEELIIKGEVKINNKVFLDIGCNEPIIHSNSYYFESSLGFRVIAVDAISEMKEKWKELRPNSKFICCAVGHQPGSVSFNVLDPTLDSSMFSSIEGVSKKTRSNLSESRIVRLDTITNILNSLDEKLIDILSIDIEGYELQALNGIDFSQIKVNLIIVENNNDKLLLGNDAIRKLLIDHGYEFKARFWNLDDLYIKKAKQ